MECNKQCGMCERKQAQAVLTPEQKRQIEREMQKQKDQESMLCIPDDRFTLDKKTT